VVMSRSRGDSALECTALLNLGEVRLHTGRFELAESIVAQAMKMADERGDRLRRAEALGILAEIWSERGESGRCAAALEEALILTNGGEDALLEAELWRLQARLGQFSATPAAARTALSKARELLADAGAWQQVANVDSAIADLSAE